MASLPTKIRAVKQDAFGDADSMFVGDVSIPSLSDDEILIQVCSSAVNRADTLMRKGKYPNQKSVMPLGLEASGKIVRLGDQVDATKWNLDQKVMTLLPGGGYSEYIKAKEKHVMPVPHEITTLDAGGIPEVWLTAYQLLHLVGSLKSSDVVLVHGAGSGVGTAAVQLIKLHGASCIATAGSKEKIKKAVELGAAIGFNYKTENFDERVLNYTNGEGVDLVLDCVGSSFWKQNFKCLKTDSRWVLYGLLGGGSIDGNFLSMILSKRISLLGTTLMSRSNDYKAKLINEFSLNALPHFGVKLFPVIDKAFTMDQVAEAHKYLESNQNIGKVLLKINETL